MLLLSRINDQIGGTLEYSPDDSSSSVDYFQLILWLRWVVFVICWAMGFPISLAFSGPPLPAWREESRSLPPGYLDGLREAVRWSHSSNRLLYYLHVFVVNPTLISLKEVTTGTGLSLSSSQSFHHSNIKYAVDQPLYWISDNITSGLMITSTNSRLWTQSSDSSIQFISSQPVCHFSIVLS
jgi:hypothetical protein